MSIHNNMSIYSKIKNFVINNRKKTVVISVVILGVLIFIFSDHGLIKRILLELELKEKQELININKQTTDSLQLIINQLQSDSLEIERISREKYGMTKENEEVFYIKKNQ